MEEFRAGCRTCRFRKFRTDLIHGLLGPAFTVAMLGAIESLMSAVVADRMSNDRHNPNVELIGQGVANIFSPMFGGLPATGAIARTATNIRVGGADAGGGDDPRADAAVHSAVCGAAGQLCADGGAGGNSDGRRLQHGRVARDSATAEADQDRYQHLAGDVCADGICRLNRRGRGGDDSGGAAVHQPRGVDYHRFTGDRRLRRRRASTHSAGQGHSVLRDDLPHSRAVSVRGDRQDFRGDRRICTRCRRW